MHVIIVRYRKAARDAAGSLTGFVHRTPVAEWWRCPPSRDPLRPRAGRAASVGLVAALGFTLSGFDFVGQSHADEAMDYRFPRPLKSKSTCGSKYHPELLNSDRGRLRTMHEWT
jgi:hypothetical protein